MWQTKGLKEGDFGSVARKELTGEFSNVWQGKDLGNSDIDSKGFAALLLGASSEVQIPKELTQSPIGSKGVAGANWPDNVEDSSDFAEVWQAKGLEGEGQELG
jgi:hypothetical protein